MGSVSVVLTMPNYLNSTQNPPIQKSPEDIIRTLQLQLAQRAAGGSGLASTSYRYLRDKRKAPHEDPIWDNDIGGLGPRGEESQTVKRRGDRFTDHAGELRQYLDVLQQHEVEPYMLTPSPPLSPPPPPPPPPPTNAVAFVRLPSPVIIPQRRIMNRSRGFVCNYSSSLRNAGIDEKAFSTFINQLNRLAELKPRAQAIDFSGFAHLCYNTHHDIFISMAVGTAFETAKSIQPSTAMNKLIDKTNNELFKPKGLVCLLMTWEPEGPEGSSLDRAFRSRPVQRVKNERRSMEIRPKANLSPFQGMGMFEWLQPTTFKRIDGDANVLPEARISATRNQYPLQSDDTEYIDSRKNQRLAVHNHLEHRHGSQVATVDFGVRARSQEVIPFQPSETTGQSMGQITLNSLDRCSALLEEKKISDSGLSPFWNPASVMSPGDAKEGQTEDRYLRKDPKDMDPFISTLPPSFTTGALKALETETLYVLIANMPDDEETQRGTI